MSWKSDPFTYRRRPTHAVSIGAVGVGVNGWEILADFARRADFDAFLLAGRYTLLDQSALAELLPLCQQKGISIIAGGVYNSGILSHPDPASVSGVSSGADAIETWKDNVTYNYVPAEREIIGAEGVRRSGPFVGQAGQGGGGVAGFAAGHFLVYRRI